MPTIQHAGRMMEAARSDVSSNADDEHRVTPLELFFDLVFVFAITQVTQMIADQPTWEGLARALILLALVWWSWAVYAWLTNALEIDQDRVRIVMFVAMMGMFVVALSLPDAFGDKGLLFALAYAVVRGAHILLFATARDEITRQGPRALAPTAALACALVVGAAFLDGPAQATVLVLALVIDYLGAGRRGIDRWTLHPSYFAERHGLIVIVAFGESIVATGIGAAETDLGSGEIAAGALAIALAAAMWWAYFDVVALVAEKRLSDAAPGRAQNTLARDAYSYLHLLFIAAIVLVALGSKKTIAHVGDHLEAVPAVALCGGLALYLLAHVVLRLRTIGTLNRQRLLAALAAGALIPLATAIPALATLALATTLMCALIAYEAVHFRQTRSQVRNRPAPTPAPT